MPPRAATLDFYLIQINNLKNRHQFPLCNYFSSLTSRRPRKESLPLLNKNMKLLPALMTTAFLCPALSSAATIYGLTSANGLISFDSSTPGTITNIGTISQVGIVDIDFYPVNGLLYGATSAGSLYTINIVTGVATLAATPSSPVVGLTAIDFNPVADRLRIFAGNSNFRLTPDVFNNPGLVAGQLTNDGIFSFDNVDLVSSAYTNPVDGAATTTLYSIDAATNSLFVHSGGPQFSTVAPVGPLGFNVGANVGFDIGTDGIAYMTDNQNLYTVNLATGAATLTGVVGTAGGSGLVKIAIPEVSSASLLLLGGLAALRRRRA